MTHCSKTKWTSARPEPSQSETSITALPTMVSLLVLCDAGQAVTSLATRAWIKPVSAQAALKRCSARSPVVRESKVGFPAHLYGIRLSFYAPQPHSDT